jgi:cyanophycinase
MYDPKSRRLPDRARNAAAGFGLPIALIATILALAACASAPSAPPAAPRGSLLIVGGGPLPDSILSRFVELAGGAGAARIVVLPMASSDPSAGLEISEDFRRLGASAERLSLSRSQADTDAAAQRIARATGIWFGGGDQSKLAAALLGTRVEAEVRERYRTGAVVGGTSAGAAVMSSLMLTGEERRPEGDHPPPKDSEDASMTIVRDDVVTAEGFGLLPGAIVDQHFVRRRRNNRLLSVVLEHPDLVGVGIDESTAVEVGPDGPWKVLGKSVVVVIDARRARVTPPGTALGAVDVRLQILPAGSSFDLRTGVAGLPPAGSRDPEAPSRP